MFQTQLDDLAPAFSQTTIVLNYCGGPLAIGPYAGKREEAFTEWRDRIRKIASLPNTFVKLGGLGMKMIGFTFFENPDPPSSQDLEKAWRPYIETCIEAFGPQRSMFESNSPVDKGTCSYQVLWNAFKRVTTGYSAGRPARRNSRAWRDLRLGPRSGRRRREARSCLRGHWRAAAQKHRSPGASLCHCALKALASRR
jgi:predicted TIM-barrel fold metal-dependent hydrolase